MPPLTPDSRPHDCNSLPLPDAALAYVQLGWRVFPLRPGDKRPLAALAPNGFKDATTDEEQVRAWWAQTPDANIGLATGPGSGLLAIDVDAYKDGVADDPLFRGPTTLKALSAHGGLHFYYRYPDGSSLTIGEGKPRKGWDFRGEGGYIVAPPSRLADAEQPYQWTTLALPALASREALTARLLPPGQDWLEAVTTPAAPSAPARPARPVASAAAAARQADDILQRAPDALGEVADHFLHKAIDQTVEGRRSHYAHWLACQLRDNGLSIEGAEPVMEAFALAVASIGTPDYFPQDAIGTMRSAYKTPPREPTPFGGQSETGDAPGASTAAGRTSKADAAGAACVQLLLDGGKPFRDLSRQPYIDLDLGGGERRIVRLWDAEVGYWLHARYYAAHGVPVGQQTVAAAIATVQGMAMTGTAVHPVYTRLAPDGAGAGEGGLYLDLGRDNQVVHVTSTGWEVVPCPDHIKFQRPEGYLPLPLPRRTEATLAELRPFLNVGEGRQGDDHFRLMVAWLLGTLMPDGEYPVLALSGPKGSAKTSTMRYLRRLVDPNEATDNGPPDKEEDLRLQAAQTWVSTFDNLTGIKGWFSDALCRLCTGMAAGKRKLYADEQRIIYRLRRPVLLNGIHELARNDDLMQRTLRIKLTPVPAGKCRESRDLDREFEATHPFLLGALLDAVVVALRERERVSKTEREKPRLATWYTWVLAAERSGKLGWEPREGDDLNLKATIWRNQDQGRRTVLANTPFADALLRWMAGQHAERRFGHEPQTVRGGVWEGSMLELKQQLTSWAYCAGYAVGTAVLNWPATPQAMTARLEALEDDLAAEGLTILRQKRTHARGRTLRLVYNRRTRTAAEDDEDDIGMAA